MAALCRCLISDTMPLADKKSAKRKTVERLLKRPAAASRAIGSGSAIPLPDHPERFQVSTTQRTGKFGSFADTHGCVSDSLIMPEDVSNPANQCEYRVIVKTMPQAGELQGFASTVTDVSLSADGKYISYKLAIKKVKKVRQEEGSTESAPPTIDASEE